MTALPPDEVIPTPHIPSSTTQFERKGGAAKLGGDGEGGSTEVYGSSEAADFVRRGACMVAWPVD